MYRALLSVSDRHDLERFARGLQELDFELWGSRGTAQFLNERDVVCNDVASIAGIPPIMNHAVVTLQAAVHAGLRADTTAEHQADLDKVSGKRFHLVYCTFYPLPKLEEFKALPLKEARELKIDIGGPALLDMGTKGDRIVVSSSKQLGWVLDRLRSDEGVEEGARLCLQARAAKRVAEYKLDVSVFYNEVAKQMAPKLYAELRELDRAEAA